MQIVSNIYFKIFSFITIIYGIFFNYFILLFFLTIACFLIYRSNNKYIYIIISCFFITFFLFDIIIKARHPDSDYVTKTEIEYEVNEILVESGPTFSGAMIDEGLVDELVIYMTPKLFGHESLPLFNLKKINEIKYAKEYEFSDIRKVGKDLRLTMVIKE